MFFYRFQGKKMRWSVKKISFSFHQGMKGIEQNSKKSYKINTFWKDRKCTQSSVQIIQSITQRSFSICYLIKIIFKLLPRCDQTLEIFFLTECCGLIYHSGVTHKKFNSSINDICTQIILKILFFVAFSSVLRFSMKNINSLFGLGRHRRYIRSLTMPW